MEDSSVSVVVDDVSVHPGTPTTTPCRASHEAELRGWLTSFLTTTRAEGIDPAKILAGSFKRQHRFLGLAEGERYELQIVEPDLKDESRRFDEQKHRFAYTDTFRGGVTLLLSAAREYGYQGLYVIPQLVNPAALSKAAPDAWHVLGSGAGTTEKDIVAFLSVYADLDTIREGGAKKVSATTTELMTSCERGIQLFGDAAEILGSANALAFLFSGNGCQVHVALDRLPVNPEVKALRTAFVQLVGVIYSDEHVVGDDSVVNPNRLCPAAGTLKRKGYNDIGLGRVHRLTGIYCSKTVERLSLKQLRHLVEGLKQKLTDEQRQRFQAAVEVGTKKGVGKRPATTTTSARSTKYQGPNPFELANTIPIRDVYAELGHDPSHPQCPGCGADDTTDFLDEKLGVQSLKCQHATCGARSWKNIDLVVTLGLHRDIDDQDARREAVNWLSGEFPGFDIPKVGKGKKARKAEVESKLTENPKFIDDMIETCSPTSRDDELREIVEVILSTDAGPAATSMKALTKKTGIPKTKLLALTKEENDGSGDVSPMDEDYSDAEWRTKLHRTKKGAVQSTFSNAVTVVSHDPRWAGRLAWCEFTSRIVLMAAAPWPNETSSSAPFTTMDAWVEPDDHRLVDYLQRFWGITVTPKQAYQAARLVADKWKVHPVRDYLGGLVWDGTHRLDTWFTTYLGCSDGIYTRKVGPWTLMQAVKRIFEPGCQADYVPVFEGDQGIKKSSAVMALCPDPSWVSDTMITIGTKDAMVALRGRWFVELPEASSLLKAEHATSKAFFTSKTDDYRPPYGMHNVQVPRQVMFFATINPEGGYLRDPTGNRRYWPIACGETGKIDIEGIERDRDQLWAEAVHRYREHERCYPDQEDEHVLFRNVQQQRGEQDPWHEAIENSVADLNEVTVSFILNEVLSIETSKQETRDQNRIIKVLTSLGWCFSTVGKVTENDPARTSAPKRKSVRIYARKEPIEDAILFKPGMTSADLHCLRHPITHDDHADTIHRLLEEAV